jgi:hypothetical protein
MAPCRGEQQQAFDQFDPRAHAIAGNAADAAQDPAAPQRDGRDRRQQSGANQAAPSKASPQSARSTGRITPAKRAPSPA